MTTPANPTPAIRFFRDGKPMPDSQNKLASVAYQCTAGLYEDTDRITTGELVALLAKAGVTDPGATSWDVTLPNDRTLSARIAGDRKAVPAKTPVVITKRQVGKTRVIPERAPRVRTARAARPKVDTAAEMKRLADAKAEHTAVKAWEKGGRKGTRPATPNLDAIKANYDAKEAAKAEASTARKTATKPAGRKSAVAA